MLGLLALTLAAHAATTLSGDRADGYGFGVASAGDVDGDGYEDLLVASPTGGPNHEGQVSFYRGSWAGIQTFPSIVLTGYEPDGGFGLAMDGAGDVNGDGYGDVVIGAWQAGNDAGAAYVFLGSALGLTSTIAAEMDGMGDYDRLGFAVSGAGDVNGDGYDDVAIGAPGDAIYGDGHGRVEIWAGNAAGAPRLAWETVGAADGDALGASVTSADVNGDGYSDVVAGAEGHDSFAGAVYMYPGGRRGVVEAGISAVEGRFPNDFFGALVASAGDIDRDGYDDLAVADREGTESHFTILDGSAAGPVLGQDVLTDEPVSRVAGLDVNADAQGDVLVSSVYADGLAGNALLYTGTSDGLSEEPSRALMGAAGGDELGAWIAGADVNGDGRDDMIAAIPLASQVAVAEGSFDLDLSVGVSPDTVTAYVGYADPGDRVWVYAAKGQPAAGPCPDALGGLCFDIRQPRLFGSFFANDTGGGSTTRTFANGGAPGTPVTFQAVILRDNGWHEALVSRTLTAAVPL